MSISFPITDSGMGGVFDYLYRLRNDGTNSVLVHTNQSSIYKPNPFWSGAHVLVIPNKGTATIDNFASNSVAFSNFTISFPFHLMKITHYKFQTRTDSHHNRHFPVSWVLHASRNGITWFEINRITASGFNTFAEIKTFPIANVVDSFIHFRFTQTSTNSVISHHFVLHRVEFFGTLTDVCHCFSHRNKCQCHRNMLFDVIFTLTTIE